MSESGSILDKAYEIHPDSGAYIIAVNLERYEEVFNDWDPAPLRRRDINPYLRDYLEESSEDIPLPKPIILRLIAPAAIEDPAKEGKMLLGMRNYFQLMERLHRRARARSRRQLIVQALVAVSLLTLVRIIPDESGGLGMLYGILQEGMIIGGWVFGWEAISNFSIQRFHELREERKWARLRKAEVQVRYSDNSDKASAETAKPPEKGSSA